MPVPSTAADLSTTAASNSPAGTDSIGTSLDEYLRSIQAIIKQENSKGTDIASAGTITIPSAGSYFVVTGTTTITAINDSWTGRAIALKFSGVLTLTNSAGLIIPGGNKTTTAGDSAFFVNESTGVWRCIGFQASGGVSLTPADIGVTVQGYDADTAKLDVDQAWTGSQRGTPTTDNDLSFDLNAANNFTCTPTGAGSLTFTNHTSGQSGFILLDNSGGYAISAAATTKVGSTTLATISAAGIYLLSYYDNGTNAYVVNSGALS